MFLYLCIVAVLELLFVGPRQVPNPTLVFYILGPLKNTHMSVLSLDLT